MIAKVVILCVIFSATHAITLIEAPLFVSGYNTRPVLRDASGRFYFGELPANGVENTNAIDNVENVLGNGDRSYILTDIYGGPRQLDSAAEALGLAYSVNANEPGIVLRPPANTASPYASSASPAAAHIFTDDPVDFHTASISGQAVTPPTPVSPQISSALIPAVPVSTQTYPAVSFTAPAVSPDSLVLVPPVPDASYNNAFGLPTASRYTPSFPVSPYTNTIGQRNHIFSPYGLSLYGSDNTRSHFL